MGSDAQAEQLYTLLPLMGFSDACQLGVIDAGITCLGDFQAVQAVFSDPDVQAEISEVSGIDFASLASTGAPTLEDQISQLVDALVPVAQNELPTKDADGNGMISAQCCTKMAPLVTENCMCTEKAMNIVYDSLKGRDITDLNPYGKLIAGVMDKLQCSALENLVFYPSSVCPASRRLALFLETRPPSRPLARIHYFLLPLEKIYITRK